MTKRELEEERQTIVQEHTLLGGERRVGAQRAGQETKEAKVLQREDDELFRRNERCNELQ